MFKSVLLLSLFIFCDAGRRFRNNREWRKLRNCGPLEPLINSYPRYPEFPLTNRFPDTFPPFNRFPDMFPFPFFAQRGFRGFGIPDTVIERRIGKPCQGPVIEPLIFGNFDLKNETLKVGAGVTLITDERRETGEICLILVDTGSSNKRMELLRTLSAVGVMPEYINNLVLTHMDLDSAGNLNLFPGANVYVGNRRAKGETIYFPKVAPSFDQPSSGLPFTQLCDNTFIYLTPGFTNEDISVVVKNVAGYGTVSITGNLILNENDVNNGDNSVKRFSQNEDQIKTWEMSRNEIMALSNFIIPGYGQPFNVSTIGQKPSINEPEPINIPLL